MAAHTTTHTTIHTTTHTTTHKNDYDQAKEKILQFNMENGVIYDFKTKTPTNLDNICYFDKLEPMDFTIRDMIQKMKKSKVKVYLGVFLKLSKIISLQLMKKIWRDTEAQLNYGLIEEIPYVYTKEEIEIFENLNGIQIPEQLRNYFTKKSKMINQFGMYEPSIYKNLFMDNISRNNWSAHYERPKEQLQFIIDDNIGKSFISVRYTNAKLIKYYHGFMCNKCQKFYTDYKQYTCMSCQENGIEYNLCQTCFQTVKTEKRKRKKYLQNKNHLYKHRFIKYWDQFNGVDSQDCAWCCRCAKPFLKMYNHYKCKVCQMSGDKAFIVCRECWNPGRQHEQSHRFLLLKKAKIDKEMNNIEQNLNTNPNYMDHGENRCLFDDDPSSVSSQIEGTMKMTGTGCGDTSDIIVTGPHKGKILWRSYRFESFHEYQLFFNYFLGKAMKP